MMLGVPRLLPQRRPCPRWRLRERRQGHLSVDKFPLPVDVVHVVEVLHGGVPHTLVGVRVHSQGITVAAQKHPQLCSKTSYRLSSCSLRISQAFCSHVVKKCSDYGENNSKTSLWSNDQ